MKPTFRDREEKRIRFLLQRDGVQPTIAWVSRTLRIYRAAVLNKNNYASGERFRRGFIYSCCEFKRFLIRMNAYGKRKDPMSGGDNN